MTKYSPPPLRFEARPRLHSLLQVSCWKLGEEMVGWAVARFKSKFLNSTPWVSVRSLDFKTTAWRFFFFLVVQAFGFRLMGRFSIVERSVLIESVRVG